jgi:hypothetical protein
MLLRAGRARTQQRVALMRENGAPPNKRMKLTSLSAAPGQMEAPPRAPHGKAERRTGSQLIRGVRRTGRSGAQSTRRPDGES